MRKTAADLGRLDQRAIRPRARKRPGRTLRNADELHDALMQLGFMNR